MFKKTAWLLWVCMLCERTINICKVLKVLPGKIHFVNSLFEVFWQHSTQDLLLQILFFITKTEFSFVPPPLFNMIVKFVVEFWSATKSRVFKIYTFHSKLSDFSMCAMEKDFTLEVKLKQLKLHYHLPETWLVLMYVHYGHLYKKKLEGSTCFGLFFTAS